MSTQRACGRSVTSSLVVLLYVGIQSSDIYDCIRNYVSARVIRAAITTIQVPFNSTYRTESTVAAF